MGNKQLDKKCQIFDQCKKKPYKISCFYIALRTAESTSLEKTDKSLFDGFPAQDMCGTCNLNIEVCMQTIYFDLVASVIQRDKDRSL